MPRAEVATAVLWCTGVVQAFDVDGGWPAGWPRDMGNRERAEWVLARCDLHTRFELWVPCVPPAPVPREVWAAFARGGI